MHPDIVSIHPKSLLVVDDDPLFLRTFSSNLVAEGYVPHCFTDLQAALVALQERQVEVAMCIIDLDMPGLDGLTFLSLLGCTERSPPVILVTAHSEHVYEEEALRLGAADFIDKSRGPAIILRRIALALRGPIDAPGDPSLVDLHVGELMLRLSARRVEWRASYVPFSRTEFDVLQLFARRAGQAVSYREIYDAIKGTGFVAGAGEEGYRANVRATIKRIRRKFECVDAKFSALSNNPGRGYTWIKDA